MIQGVKINRGAGIERGAWSQTVTPSASAQNVIIPEGHHNGKGKVTVLPIPASALYCNVIGCRTWKRENSQIWETSTVWDTGNNNRKAICIYLVNMADMIIEGSNDQYNWTEVTKGSTGGSNDGAWGNPFYAYVSNQTYRYYRSRQHGYNNGGGNYAVWFIVSA